MKQIVILILFATLFVACNNDAHDEDPVMPDLTQIRLKGSNTARLEYIGKIGNDFESALDSLTRKREPMLNALAKMGSYSGEYNIDKKKIDVDFSYDSRYFILLTFIDKTNNYPIFSSIDVIDEKGNYYGLIWPED